jgi:predicted nucleotide-binding protein (sugar kinase/HSP70/actin superfamily)
MVAINGTNPLKGRKLYIPQICSGSVQIFCGALRALGIDASPNPESDLRTRELAAPHCAGDECYPQIITLGNFLKVTEQPDFEQEKTAFFMPTTSGPCRFGQYNHLIQKIFDSKGLKDVLFISPTCDNGYRDLGSNGTEIMRYGWWAMVAGDLLRKMLHHTRPYEINKGETDSSYAKCVEDTAQTLGRTDSRGRKKFTDLQECQKRSLARFKAIEADYSQKRLLIGVVGEIFCRLNTFSNGDVIRKIEEQGGEVWLSGMSEWLLYCNYMEIRDLKMFGKSLSSRMISARVSDWAQRRDEHLLSAPFAETFKGLEEPHKVGEVIELGERYIDSKAALGEMMMSIGKVLWLHRKGVDAVLDISPFSCMNGIVSESIYPRVSSDLDGLPVRVFYFDGTLGNLDDDVGIFLELASHYSKAKNM